LLEVAPASMRIEGTREEREGWTGMGFPADGDTKVSSVRGGPAGPAGGAALLLLL
jgi:hypothetical protein